MCLNPRIILAEMDVGETGDSNVLKFIYMSIHCAYAIVLLNCVIVKYHLIWSPQYFVIGLKLFGQIVFLKCMGQFNTTKGQL